ncbi:hypothetical protein AYO40_05875 [Planctomycetaceae bacterium SCGC AG-212-D15]|nr:hypothetical protein AYO40_05875 [Planctomycetaceae bacterium SCGC AG-212-D15]
MTCNRREFLASAAVAAFATGIAPAAAEGKPAIIDTHVHFYDPTRPQGVPWPGKDDKLLYRPFLPRDFRAVTKDQGVTGVVVVEASPWLEDNQWVLDLAKEDPFVVGIVGHLNPGTEDFRKHFERFARNPRFRGIRVSQGQVQKEIDKEGFIEDLKRLQKGGLALDVNGGPELPALVARLAERLPELRIVINHEANVTIDGKAVPEAWLAGMSAAAKHRNVACKVSALVEGTRRKDGDAPKETAFYRPVLDALWNAFGEDRLIYGSNWPVSQRCASYATIVAIVREYFKDRGEAATGKFFHGNAEAAYKWPKR